jgi:hypothetical protein
MGMRLAALAFDRSEALVIGATLDAAGVPNWIYCYNMIWNDPAQRLVCDRFQIVVVEQDLETQWLCCGKRAKIPAGIARSWS